MDRRGVCLSMATGGMLLISYGPGKQTVRASKQQKAGSTGLALSSSTPWGEH